MSALPPPRDPAALPRRSRFSRSSSASRFERAAFSTPMRRGDRSVAFRTETRGRARTRCFRDHFGTRLTRMPDRTFNLGHGAARESDRSLPARWVFAKSRERASPWRHGSPLLAAAAEKERARQQARKTWLLERWIRSEVLSSRSRTRDFFDGETDLLHVLCLSVTEQLSGTRVSPCGISRAYNVET